MKCGTTYRKCPSKHYYTYYTQARREVPSIDSSWFSVNPVKLPIALMTSIDLQLVTALSQWRVLVVIVLSVSLR
jgi:hypothetical protein